MYVSLMLMCIILCVLQSITYDHETLSKSCIYACTKTTEIICCNKYNVGSLQDVSSVPLV